MSSLSINFSTNALVDSSGASRALDAQKVRDFKTLVAKCLPKLDTSGKVSFRFTGTQLQIKEQAHSFTVDRFDKLDSFLKALLDIAPEESTLLEYNVHAIADPTRVQSSISSASQLAYNLYPDRLKENVLPYQQASSTVDLAENLRLDTEKAHDPHYVLGKMVDRRMQPTEILTKELRYGRSYASYHTVGITLNTLEIHGQTTHDFPRLLQGAICQAIDHEDETYRATENKVFFPETLSHLSFDLTACSLTVDETGTVAKQQITNIPFILDETHLGVPSRLYLKGAIISTFHEGAGSEYLTLFQKKHPITKEIQWFLTSDGNVRPISQERAAELLPNAIHLYYEGPKTAANITSSAEQQFRYTTQTARAQELKQMLKELHELRIEVEEPKSWLESLSDAFTGGVIELENAHTQEKLLEIHQKLAPAAPRPHLSSAGDLALLQRNLIRSITDELKKIERTLQKYQDTHLRLEQALAERQRNPSVLERLWRAVNPKEHTPQHLLARILSPQSNPDLFA